MKHSSSEEGWQDKEVSGKLGKLFGSEFLETLGVFTGFTKRIGQLDAKSFVGSCLRMVCQGGWGGSLSEHCVHLSCHYGVKIQPQSLDERFNGTSEALMKYLFEQVMRLHLRSNNPMNLLDRFEQLYVQDSTNMELPAVLQALYKGSGGGASSAGLKIDALYELRWGNVEVRFHDSAGSDHWQGVGAMKKGSLLLRDLGYFKLSDFKVIQDMESFFLSRLKFKVKVYWDAKGQNELDWRAYLQQMKDHEVRSLKVYLGKEQLLETRLVIQKVPPKVAKYKQHKLKTDKQMKRKRLSKARLEWCQLNAYITNIAESMMSHDQIVKLYSLRWIIEILFKAWKSIAGLKDKINPMKPPRFMCMLYAHMIKVLLDSKIVHFFKIEYWNLFNFKISELKAFKVLKTFNDRWWQALTNNEDPQNIKSILEQIALNILRLAKKRKYASNESYCDFYLFVKSQT